MNKLFLKLARPIFNVYTAGENIQQLNNKIIQLSKSNIYPIADYIKEFSDQSTNLDPIIDQYISLSKLDNLEYIALKLSSFNFNEKIINKLVSDLITNNKKVLIDAENNIHYDKIDKITDNLLRDYNQFDPIVFKTYQMYRKDSYNRLCSDLLLHYNLGVKLVRGAYHNEDKYSGKLYLTKEETDQNYARGLKSVILNKNRIQAFVCTHNINDINTLINFNNCLKTHKITSIYHASLYGFINNETKKIINSGIKTYKYLPYGPLEDSIPYLTRRLYEKPKILYHLL
jgi:carbapenem biosynthesis protein (putative proline dehydrogenase)